MFDAVSHVDTSIDVAVRGTVSYLIQVSSNDELADQKPDIELDWVKIREDLDSEFLGETVFDKAKRCLATTAALSVGLISFVREKSQMQQYMMRARVGAQAFTIVCIVAGFILLPKSS